MPRRNRRSPELVQPARRPTPRSAPPPWAELAGHEVRRVEGDKAYRCPGCDGPILVGKAHLVVVPLDDPEGRRHWHTECWRRELHRIRGRPRG